MSARAKFFRACRLVHGWLSAGAFLILIFFAATGLALNHPEWLPKDQAPAADSGFQLSPQDSAQLAAAADKPRTLAVLAARHAPLVGAFKSGDVDGQMLYVRMEGAKGASDLRADLRQGRVDVSIERANALSLLDELHRAEHAGPAWRLIVDLAAIGLIATSIAGYAIFLALRFQLRTALAITLASGLLMAASIVWLAT